MMALSLKSHLTNLLFEQLTVLCNTALGDTRITRARLGQPHS